MCIMQRHEEAWAVYQALVTDERIALIADEPRELGARWRTFAVGATASPKLWMDAYLAAFSLTGGHRMITTDTGFRQFVGLDLDLLGDAGDR
jgi:uncharacterized protein